MSNDQSLLTATLLPAEIMTKKVLAVSIDLGVSVINELIGNEITSIEEHDRVAELMAASILAQLNA